jgi:hypothetical protein
MSKNRKTEKARAKSDLMTDGEVCDALRITRVTLRNHLKNGPPKKRAKNSGDIRLIQHFTVGRQRRWLKSSVEQFKQGDANGN